MNIIPFTGFDNIRLGMSMDQIKAKLGINYSKLIENFEDGTNEIIWRYPNPGIDLSFNSEDGFKLGNIVFYSPSFTFKDKSIIGMEEENLLEVKDEVELNDLSEDQEFEDVFSKEYFSERKGLQFSLSSGSVISISLFPEFNETGDQIVWPA